MKNLKSVLAVLAALCLLMCLTVPAFATEADTTTTGTVAATDATTGVQDGAQVEDGDIEINLDDVTLPVAGEDAEEEHDHDHDHDHTEEVVPESTGHKVLRIILTVLEVIASVALIVIVLMQSGKEAGLSGALSGNSESYMSKDNRATMDKKLAGLTKWVALGWVVLTLILSLI